MPDVAWTDYTRFTIALLAVLDPDVDEGRCFLTLRYAEILGRWIGTIGLNIAIRLFGLVLAAIAVEFIVSGLKLMLPVLER